MPGAWLRGGSVQCGKYGNDGRRPSGPELEGAPIILQTTPLHGEIRRRVFAPWPRLAQKSAVPVALHLDHGDSFALL